MSGENQNLGQIRDAVKHVARRLRIQRVLDALTTGLALSLLLVALAIVLYKTGWVDESSFWLGCLGTLIFPSVLGIRAAMRPFDEVELARRLDKTHQLHDRLSTALSLSKEEASEFKEAQLRDAAQYVTSLQFERCAPFRRPTDIIVLGVAFGVAFFLLFLKPPSHQHPLPQPFEVQHEEVLDALTVAVEKERLEALKQALQDIDDPTTKEVIRELEQLLADVENRSISRKEFLERLGQIEEKHFDKQEDKVDQLAEQLKEAAEELEKVAKKDLDASPDAKKLVDALKQKDLAKAAQAAEDLAKKLQNDEMSQKELERLASVLEKFSELIDPNDPKIQKLMEENKELIRKLQDLFDQNKLSDKEKKRLNDLKKKQDEMEKRGNAQKGKMTSRELQQLQRKTEDMAKKAREAAEQKKENAKSKKPDDAAKQKESDFRQEASRRAEEMKEALEQGAKEQEKKDAQRMAQKQLDELREAMQRQRSQGQKESESEQRGEQMKDFLERARGEKERAGSTEKGQGEGNSQRQKEQAGGEDKSNSEGPKPQKSHESNSANLGEGFRELGEETSMDSKKVDENLSGRDAKGASKSEIIRAASEEGFANTQYKDVFVDYESVVEEVMEKEKVPPGYRYYVKRYFQLIRPQE